MRKVFNQLLVIGFCMFFVSFSSVEIQDKELKQKADTYFKDQEYLKALPLYSQLLSLKPTDAELNFKYGACLIFDKGGTEKPIKYLKFATENNAPVEAFYFLGKAYHLNYQFRDAIDSYSFFLSNADNKLKETYEDAQRQIEMCAFGSKLLNNIKEIFVLDKTIAADVEFFRNYDLTDVGGRILVTPDELLSSNDKRFNHRSLIHFPGESSKIYFASYGKEDHTDIYTSTIMADGSFSKPVKVGGNINTKYNEDFPFLHPDGQTLYFSSQGHNSMGGYDIFKSEMNGSNQFSKPINLDFAINSPDDDIFYIADANNKLAYFASGRSSGEGDIHVYKVMVESRPLNMAVIKGQFNSEISSEIHDASIYVQDATTNEEIGKFYTNTENGEYIIVLPKSGRYKFFVEAPESKYTHSGLVEIPPSEEIRAFKQTMDLVEVNEKEKLIIKNLFEESIDEDIMALVQQVIKERAELNINADESDLDEFVLNDFGTIYEQAGFQQNTTKAEVIDALSSKENELEEIINEQKSVAEKSKNFSMNKTSSAETSLVKAEELFARMKSTDDQKEKELLLVQAAKQKGESMEQADEAIVAMELSNFMSDESAKNELLLKGFKQGNALLNDALETENANALTMLKEQKQFMDETRIDAPEDQLAKQAAEERNRTEKILNRATDLSDELNVLEKRLEGKVRSLEKAKKEKERVQIGNEIQVLEDEIELVERDKNKAFEELADKQRSANVLEGGQELVQNLDEGEIEVKGDVYISTDQLDKDIAEIIKRNDNIEISEVEIQEILINRPSLVNVLFTSERELAAFKSTFHLPDYISLDETSDMSDNSSDVVTVDEISIAEEIEDDNIDPEELSLKTELVEFDVVQELIYPDIDEKVNDVIFSDASSNEKSLKITEIKDQFDSNLEDARMALFNLRDKGEIDDLIFEKNAAFLDELGTSKLNEINKVIAAYEPRVRDEIEVDNYSANTTHDLYNSAGVSEEEIDLKKRLANIHNSSDTPHEVAERSIEAREEYIEILKNKISQNNINIQYAPSVEMEQKIKKQNEALEEIVNIKMAEIEENKTFLTQVDTPANNQLTENPDQKESETIGSPESNIPVLDYPESYNSELVTETSTAELALNEIKSGDSSSDYNRLKMSPRDYRSKAALESFPDQSMLYREAKYMMEVDVNGAVDKEILIIEKAETANNHELDYLVSTAKNAGISENDEQINDAIRSFSHARALRDSAETISDNSDKLFLLKHAYGFELKGLESLEFEINEGLENLAVADSSQNSKFQTSSINDELEETDEETYFKSQANEYKVETNKKIDPEILEVLIDPTKRDLDQILSSDLGYSEDEVLEIKNNDERLAEVLRDWKVAKIDDEITTQQNYALTYQNQYDQKTLAYRDIQNVLNETSDPGEKERLSESASDLLAEAEVLDYYKKVAENNISELEIKRNDVVNGELNLAQINEGEQYVELSDFVNRYYEGDNPFDLLKIAEENDSIQTISTVSDSIQTPLTEEEIAKQKVAELQKRIASELINDDEENVLSNEEDLEPVELDRPEENSGNAVIEEPSLIQDSLDTSGFDDNIIEDPDLSIQTQLPETNDVESLDSMIGESKENTTDIVDVEASSPEINEETNNKLEFEEGVDRDTKLIIVDGSDELYQYKNGDVRGLENKLTSEPFNPYQFEVPHDLEDEVYFLSDEDIAAYENVPEGIPLDIELPEGLVFQVQIGAFYKPVSPDVFKGYAPINGEKSRTGLIRYRAGMFKIFDTANKAKNEIRAKGYSDAFVVAFYNGERIPLYIGRSMLDQQTIEKYNYAQDSSRDQSENKASDKVETVDVNQNFAPVTPIEQLNGLFYTVQVGVYSKQVTEEDLHHVTPLTSEITGNNKIRYTSGIFDEFNRANTWKTEVQKLGITDAFVSAYYNGERISLREARSYNHNVVISKDEISKSVVPTNTGNNIITEEDFSIDDMTEKEVWDAFNVHMMNKGDEILYKLRFGPYENEIPMEEANLILDFKNQISFENDPSGAFMYTTNEPVSYQDIRTTRDSIQNSLIENLHIIAIKGEKEIDLVEAKTILEN